MGQRRRSEAARAALIRDACFDDDFCAVSDGTHTAWITTFAVEAPEKIACCTYDLQGSACITPVATVKTRYAGRTRIRGTWKLVPRSTWRGPKAITCRGIYVIKRSESGEIKRVKARLVIRGFKQLTGLEYTETYAQLSDSKWKDRLSTLPSNATGQCYLRALQHLDSASRPDIADAVSNLGQFLSSYNYEHYFMVKRILRYMTRTVNYGLVNDVGDGCHICGYCRDILEVLPLPETEDSDRSANKVGDVNGRAKQQLNPCTCLAARLIAGQALFCLAEVLQNAYCNPRMESPTDAVQHFDSVRVLLPGFCPGNSSEHGVNATLQLR
ncbi:hypothetical protein ON010_g8206 [Phytophthora cinnamomi]|nr:hypothetical protein ON010_g8206 [Phytophthora cinnamomi]